MTVARSTQGIAPVACGARQGDKEDVAPDVFAEDRQHLSAADLGEAGGLNVACPIDAETRVALQKGLRKKPTCKPPRTMSTPSARKTRPAVLAGRHQGRWALRMWRRNGSGRARNRRRPGSSISSGMPGSARPVGGTTGFTRRKRGSAGASSSQTRGRVFANTLSHHA